MQVRLLRESDDIPYASLRRRGIDFWPDKLPLDPDWTWVAIQDAQIVGVLLCCQMQSLLGILRISTTPDAPPAAPMLLLRRAFRDAGRRGLLGYVTFLSDSAAAESQLMRIVQRSGGDLLPQSGAWAYGEFPKP